MNYDILLEEFDNNLEQIFEAWLPNLTKGKTPVVVTHGRFSVPHAGHFGLFELAWKEGKKKGAEKLIIVIVMGKLSSKDKDKNPTTFKQRKSLIGKGLKGIPHEVVLSNAGYTGSIIDILREKDMEPIVFTGGPDRIDDYTNQLKKSGKDWNSDAVVVGVKGDRLAGGASATKVRQAIRDDDEKSYKKYMPKGLHSEFKKLQKILGK
jgi:glycerol-3-phosphate cytidylyltransferase-like family protein